GFADGFSGIAPGADLVALRVFDGVGRSRLDWIESALRWVIDHRTSLEHPITTVNLSLGAFVPDEGQPLTQLDDELQQLRSDGVLVVAAAGNSFQRTEPSALAYPASHPLVAAVTSVDASGNLQDFAQRASGIFAMPGAAVRSSVPDHVLGVDGQIDDFAEISGTSMAAPQFAGAAMLIRQAMQSIGQTPTVDDILFQLRETALERTDAVSGARIYDVDLDAAISDVLADRATAPDTDAPDSGSPQSPLQWSDPSSLVVHASSGSDEIILDLSGPNSITVNSVAFPVARPFESLLIEGGLGNDTLRIIGGTGDERVIARAALPGLAEATASLQRLGLAADFHGFENVMLQGGGGNDRVTFFDSAQDDSLDATATGATLRGVGFTFVAVDVKNVYAHAVNGGSDTAYLYDTPEDDRLAIRHQFTSLRSETQFRLAYGFEKVQAFGGSGGRDQADLYDSPGDDRLAASASFASISSRDYYAGARGFATVRAEASSGGNDYATLYAVDTNALWTRSADLLQCTLPGGDTRTAQGFEVAEAYVAGDKIEVLPQSLAHEAHQQERRALRDLFALLDDGELRGAAGVF
ncbi:MAG: S8 family peptidase, partial [Planctomycetaceae bacterium]